MLGAVAIFAMICFTVLVCHNREIEHAEKLHDEDQTPTGIQYSVSNLRTRIDKLEASIENNFKLLDVLSGKINSQADRLSITLKQLSQLDDYKKKVDALVLKAGFKL